MDRLLVALVLLTPISCIAQDIGFLKTPNGLPYITSETYRNSLINDAVTLEELFDAESWFLLERKLGEPNRTYNDTTFVEITKIVEYEGLQFIYTNYPGELELTKITITDKKNFIRISEQTFSPHMSLAEFDKKTENSLIPANNIIKIYIGKSDTFYINFNINSTEKIISNIEIIRSFI